MLARTRRPPDLAAEDGVDLDRRLAAGAAGEPFGKRAVRDGAYNSRPLQSAASLLCAVEVTLKAISYLNKPIVANNAKQTSRRWVLDGFPEDILAKVGCRLGGDGERDAELRLRTGVNAISATPILKPEEFIVPGRQRHGDDSEFLRAVQKLDSWRLDH